MKIDELTVGTLTYTIRTDSEKGTIVEQAGDDNPRTLLFGMGQVMKSFSDHLFGLEENDTFSFSISPSEAYGERDVEKIFGVSKETFVENGKLRDDLLVQGKMVPLTDDEGKISYARVVEVADDEVILDFNHPLAGKTLFVEGKVVGVRKPTLDEMNDAVEKQRNSGRVHHHHEHGHCHCE